MSRQMNKNLRKFQLFQKRLPQKGLSQKGLSQKSLRQKGLPQKGLLQKGLCHVMQRAAFWLFLVGVLALEGCNVSGESKEAAGDAGQETVSENHLVIETATGTDAAMGSETDVQTEMDAAMSLETDVQTDMDAAESSETDVQTGTDADVSSEMDAQADTQTMEFTDVYGNVHTLRIDLDALMHKYDITGFIADGQKMTYSGDDSYTYRLGIDVSFYQGDIDWESVRADGYEFVFIRIGYRGYGEAGTLVEDENFRTYLEGAKAAGLDVGVYFFSQAISEEEAEEEAEFVLELLTDTELSLPVVYDPEYILDEEGNPIADARTTGLDGEQVTKNTKAFCERIEEAGYETAYYTNMLSESEVFDMTALSQYTVWYADYEAYPQTPYQFTYWQYSESGTVSGIEGVVDLNIQLIAEQ